jgi:gamma-glutamylcyclotransferase (GGCT)/AIG2-like uncharacterized protein YtfP
MTDPEARGNLLFVYGTLVEPATRERILGRRVEAVAALLPGYRRGRSRHFYIVREPEATTAGMLLSGLSERDFAILDEYEGVPRLYLRERVEVISAGATVSAWVYLPTGWAGVRRA